MVPGLGWVEWVPGEEGVQFLAKKVVCYKENHLTREDVVTQQKENKTGLMLIAAVTAVSTNLIRRYLKRRKASKIIYYYLKNPVLLEMVIEFSELANSDPEKFDNELRRLVISTIDPNT